MADECAVSVIVAGCRDFHDFATVSDAIKESGFKIAEIVSGGASGVDALGARWAKEHDIPVKYFKARWDLHGKAAGPIRNGEMAVYADALVAIWDGKSPGTMNMISQAGKTGVRVFVKRFG